MKEQARAQARQLAQEFAQRGNEHSPLKAELGEDLTLRLVTASLDGEP